MCPGNWVHIIILGLFLSLPFMLYYTHFSAWRNNAADSDNSLQCQGLRQNVGSERFPAPAGSAAVPERQDLPPDRSGIHKCFWLSVLLHLCKCNVYVKWFRCFIWKVCNIWRECFYCTSCQHLYSRTSHRCRNQKYWSRVCKTCYDRFRCMDR